MCTCLLFRRVVHGLRPCQTCQERPAHVLAFCSVASRRCVVPCLGRFRQRLACGYALARAPIVRCIVMRHVVPGQGRFCQRLVYALAARPYARLSSLLRRSILPGRGPFDMGS